MRRLSGCCLGLLLLVSPALAERTRGKTVVDFWDAAYLPSGKAGYLRTSVVEIERDGKKVLRSTMEINLTLKRNRDTVSLRMETGMEETPEGKVLGVFTRHYLGKKQQLHLVGAVVGKQLQLWLIGKDGTKQMLKPAPWNDQVIGMARQQRLFQEKKVKPGDKFDFQSFEPAINLVIGLHVHVKGREKVKLPGSKAAQRLLHVEVKSDELRMPRPDGQVDRFQPPPLHFWLDKDLKTVRSQQAQPGLGTITGYRTTRARALATENMGTITDIGISQLIRLKKRIVRPLDARVAVYRITIKGEKDAASALAQDGRQVVKNGKGDTFELHVRASRGPRAVEDEDRTVSEEYLKSSYFINWDNELVKEHAQEAVGAAKDPWQKALRIERWVKANMHFTNDEALATADHVARTLEGDCSEHAMLAAAMCRAEGVPSRTATGLIYADTRRGPVMAFHMWTEVWVRGQWVAIDGTLGRGYVGATHIKITDQSWHDTRTLTPMLPVARVVGKMSIEVVRVK